MLTSRSRSVYLYCISVVTCIACVSAISEMHLQVEDKLNKLIKKVPQIVTGVQWFHIINLSPYAHEALALQRDASMARGVPPGWKRLRGRSRDTWLDQIKRTRPCQSP